MEYRRLLNPEIFEDDPLFDALGCEGVLFYMRMWGLSEGWGGLEYNPKSLARKSGALNLSAKKVEKIIQKLIEMGKIYPYELENKSYLWLKNLSKHQNLKRIPESQLPLPAWIEETVYEHETKKAWNYKVIENLAPHNQTVERPSKDRPQNAHSITKHLQNKNKDRDQDRPEQNKPEQDIPDHTAPPVTPIGDDIPPRGDLSLSSLGQKQKQKPKNQDQHLSGDDLLRAFALKTCPECQGTGQFVYKGDRTSCLCVKEYLEMIAKEYLGEVYTSVAGLADTNCHDCLGYGINWDGDRENTKVKKQCDCRNKRKLKVAND